MAPRHAGLAAGGTLVVCAYHPTVAASTATVGDVDIEPAPSTPLPLDAGRREENAAEAFVVDVVWPPATYNDYHIVVFRNQRLRWFRLARKLAEAKAREQEFQVNFAADAVAAVEQPMDVHEPALDCDIPRARQKKFPGDSPQMDIAELTSAGESSLESVETTSLRSDTDCEVEPAVKGAEISDAL